LLARLAPDLHTRLAAARATTLFFGKLVDHMFPRQVFRETIASVAALAAGPATRILIPRFVRRILQIVLLFVEQGFQLGNIEQHELIRIDALLLGAAETTQQLSNRVFLLLELTTLGFERLFVLRNDLLVMGNGLLVLSPLAHE